MMTDWSLSHQSSWFHSLEWRWIFCAVFLTSTHIDLDPPRDLEMRDSTETTLELVWKRPRAKISTYRLTFVSADGRREGLELPATATTHTLAGLTPGMRYTVTLVAERARRRSAPATVTASTGEGFLTFDCFCNMIMPLFCLQVWTRDCENDHD